VNIEEAKIYETAVGKRPEFAALAQAVSKSLHDLCKFSDTNEAYEHGEHVRMLFLQWMTMGVSVAFDCGKKAASSENS
jgi:hypothetical protein